jgi:Nif-specific regulatory protein
MMLPPLRNRGEDVLDLADFFLTMFCTKIGRSKPTWTPGAKRRLATHDWPGNVRELRNIVERIAYLTTGDTLDESQVDFVRSPRMMGDGMAASTFDLNKTLGDATADFQTRFIEEQIKACSRNVTQAAEKMGLQRSNLYRKMKQLGMNQPE